MVKKILIVGGGSAGWSTAAYMSKKLKNIQIELIESSDIPVVGVGESTVPPIVQFMEELGLSEEEWMPKCNATYKSSIRFKNFHQLDEPAMWYPFEPVEILNNRPLSRYWHYKHLTDKKYANRYSFYDYNFIVPEICRQNKTVKSIPNTSYAYHFDAGLWGEVLKELAKKNGVKQYIDTITEVHQDEKGNITSVSRKDGDDIEADLFIDCSGFASLLIGKTLNEPFEDMYKHLFNNKAIAMPLPYEDKEKEMVSYTNCHALSSGWVWTTPLYNRIGTGYVYSDKYKDPEDAEHEFRTHLGFERVKDLQARHIDIRVGKHKRTWVKNCVAIGLSAGFIEPLESTGLQIIQGAVQLLTNTLMRENGHYNVCDVKVYNDSITRLLDIIRDFLTCHYALTDREDTPYWHDVKYNSEISESLSEKLQFARLAMPDAQHINRFDNASLAGFSFNEGWQCILTGMNYLPFDWPQLQHNNVGPYEEAIKANMHLAEQRQKEKDKQKSMIPSMPSHYQYLKKNIYKQSN